MKLAADFRREAREALRGRWPIAILFGLAAAVLGGTETGTPEVKLNYDVASGVSATFGYAGQSVYSTGQGFNPRWSGLLIGGAVYLVVIALVLGVLFFILGSIVRVGYARYNLGLVDRTECGFETLFAYLSDWKTTALTQLLKSVYIFLWSLLFLVPGIIAGYTYAMTNFILAEHPDMTPGEALRASRAMMTGNRWRLFCLHFSFIGWKLLCSLTFGLGNLVLQPYCEAANAAFYRELTGADGTVI